MVDNGILVLIFLVFGKLTVELADLVKQHKCKETLLFLYIYVDEIMLMQIEKCHYNNMYILQTKQKYKQINLICGNPNDKGI